MGEGGEFPASEMAGKEEDSFAAGEGVLVIFESAVDDDIGDILARIAGKEADLGELAAEGNVFSAQNAAAIFGRHLREGESEVAHADFAQAAMKMKDGEAEGDADGARHGAGKHAHEFDRGPDERVFETFAHLPECRG